MNTRIFSALTAVIVLVTCLTACSDSKDTTLSIVSAADAVTSVAEVQKRTDEGDLGDYYVKILDCETGLKDYDENPVIGVKFSFTNNSEEAIACDVALYMLAYQNGIELDIPILDAASDEYNNTSKNIKPGKTITCEEYYVMTSDEADVEIEVRELASFADRKLEKTFIIHN